MEGWKDLDVIAIADSQRWHLPWPDVPLLQTLQNRTRWFPSRHSLCQLNRLVNHGELNDTTDGGGGSFAFWRIIITQWFRVINSIMPYCFGIIRYFNVLEFIGIPAYCKWDIRLYNTISFIREFCRIFQKTRNIELSEKRALRIPFWSTSVKYIPMGPWFYIQPTSRRSLVRYGVLWRSEKIKYQNFPDLLNKLLDNLPRCVITSHGIETSRFSTGNELIRRLKSFILHETFGKYA